MRLVVKQADEVVNKFQFTAGPIYIGRLANSQILLPDRTVSRQHAVIFKTPDGKWMVEDLNSANKTFLNNRQIKKAEIKTGDILRITEFSIEVNLKDTTEADKAVHLEDTLIAAPRSPQIITRDIDTEHAADMRLPAKRAKDFARAAEEICQADGLDEILQALLHITAEQFAASRTWCALRSQPSGPMTSHAGKTRDGSPVQINEIKLSEKINEAVEKGRFLLLPQVPAQITERKIRSAMIAPIMSLAGCFGVLYIDNAADQEPYGLADLDYLMLLAIHTATILKNF
jgi:pSer/pThr/pTyr-binding forkhead associated (FHA) protein